MGRQYSSAQRKETFEGNGIRRNPYLVEYEGQRRRVRDRQGTEGAAAQRRPVPEDRSADFRRPAARPGRRETGQEALKFAGRDVTADLFDGNADRAAGRPRNVEGEVRPYRAAATGHERAGQRDWRDSRSGARQRAAGRAVSRRGADLADRARPAASFDLVPVACPAPRRTGPRSRAAMLRRKRQILMQRLLVCAWGLCILLFAVYFALKSGRTESAEGEGSLPVAGGSQEDAAEPQQPGLPVQGIPAEAFAQHPDWTEDLLTPNEYSRPGYALETVNNIFVHYTANPGTSAAQNRSYFEWQKDTHEASVSAHFVIGYEGEIVQCVPLDEIAYAVMTRNYDSISIECCYLEGDGSFTQATYDSLISLLAWLVDVYDLESEDILRHYDCGGKKCPLYYADHEDAWEQLKKDVDNL